MKKISLSFILLVVFLLSVKAQGPVDIWGVTFRGGAGFGAIFKTDNNGNNPSVVHSYDVKFSSKYGGARFREAANHKLYATMGGGVYDEGVIIELDPATGEIVEKASFNSMTIGGGGWYNDMVLGSNGKFYGTFLNQNVKDTRCYIYEYDIASNTIVKKAAFEDLHALSKLHLASNGKLYGVTSMGGNFNQGILFEYNIASNKIIKIGNFGSQIMGEAAMNLVDYNNKLYGCGLIERDSVFDTSIYEYDLNTKTLETKSIIKNMACSGQLAVGDDGLIYGSANMPFDSLPGVFFKFDPVNSKFTSIQNFEVPKTGGNPCGGVMKCKNGAIYGMTAYGGIYNAGSIYEYVPATSKFKIVYNFKDTLSGWGSVTTFEQAQNGKLYSCTSQGGRFNVGVIFEFDMVFRQYKKLKDLGDGLSGDNPDGSLSITDNGKIYTVTRSGGLYNDGILLECDPSNEPPTFTKKIEFHRPSNGMCPYFAPVQGPNGKLYGTTPGDRRGLYDPGTLYEYDPVTNTLTTKIRFHNPSETGSKPGGLVLASNKKFYGVSYLGGKYANGLIFEFDPATGKYSKRVDLKDGRMAGQLLRAKNNKLYGLLESESSKGALFEYSISSDTIVVLHRFEQIISWGKLVEADGKLFGIGAPSDLGQFFLFEYTPKLMLFRKLYTFSDTTSGIIPVQSLLAASNGNLYGMTMRGGSDNRGVVYEYNYKERVYTKKFDFKGPNGMHPRINNNMIEVCKPIPYHGAASTLSVCEGQELKVFSGFDKMNYTFQWYKDKSPIIGANAEYLLIPEIALGDSGVYYCNVDNGCRSIQTADATVNVLPLSDPSCGVVGIRDEEKIKFEVFPNPATDEFQIRLLNPKAHRIKVELVDVLGKLVLEQTVILSEQATILNIEHLENGIYWIKIRDEQNTILENRKLIKH